MAMSLIFKRKKILCALCLLSIMGCLKDTAPGFATTEQNAQEQVTSNTRAALKTPHGTLVIEFYPQKAPKTVARIMELIQKKFYDGISFHRVVPNFIVQGGDPTGSGMRGSGQLLPAEFNDLIHVKGTVAMARKGDINSADSQFYIALSRLEHLDGKYTIFGKVVEGLDILDKIRQGDKMISFRPY